MIYYILADDFGGLEYGVEQDKEKVPKGSKTFESQEELDAEVLVQEVLADEKIFEFISQSEIIDSIEDQIIANFKLGLTIASIVAKYRRLELNAAAESLGLNPEQFRNRRLVAEAISEELGTKN